MATVENTTVPSYSDFSNNVMLQLHHAQAILSGAHSLFEESCEWESEEALSHVSLLMDSLRKQLGEALHCLDGSSLKYELKHGAASPEA